jgi:hypothetical protein
MQNKHTVRKEEKIFLNFKTKVVLNNASYLVRALLIEITVLLDMTANWLQRFGAASCHHLECNPRYSVRK